MNEEEYILKMCANKVRYKKIKVAEHALRRIRKTGRIISPDFKPYHCNYCGGYHLGHSKYRESPRGR